MKVENKFYFFKEKCKINTEIPLVKELHKEEETSYPYCFSIKRWSYF